MLANFFGKSSPINFIIIIGVFLIYFFSNFFLIFHYIPLTEVLLFLIISLIIFFFYNIILFKNKLTKYNSYGFVFFIILFGMISVSIFDRNYLLLHGLFLIFLRRVYSLQSTRNILGKLFDSGFWLGVFFLFEPFSILFFVLIYLSNSLFQKTNWQTILVPVVGFFAPLFCAYTYYFWIDSPQFFWSYFDWYTSYDFLVYKKISLKTPLFIIGIVTLFAFLVKTPKIIGVSGSYRKYWTLLFFNLILSILFITVLRHRTGAELQFLFFPISIILTNWLESFKTRITKEAVLFLGLLLPFIIHLF